MVGDISSLLLFIPMPPI